MDETIPVPLNSNILKEIFEWLKHNIYFHKRIDTCFYSKVKTYDRNWINYIDQSLNINSFQLINIGNFLGIEFLVEIVSVYIAENHESRNFKLMVKAFFNRKKDNIPLEIAEKLFYYILLYNSENLQSQHQYKLGEEYSFGQVVVSWTMGAIKKMFPLRLVDIDSFQFFHQLDLLNFIDITNNLNLLNMFHYKNVKLNLNIEHVSAKISELVDTSSKQCILAGGCFTDYVSESSMAFKYHDMFDIFLKKKSLTFICLMMTL